MRPGIELEGKRVLVVGLARTGVATVVVLLRWRAARRVTATDTRDAEALGDAAAQNRVKLKPVACKS